MNPVNIVIKNYKSYGDEETSLDLSGNSVKLIYGDIGAGKTTFVDAIIWCLYGQSLVNQDEVINRKTKKNCKVEYNFYIKDDIYSITRYRKHEVNKDNLLIFKNHKNISPNKKKDAQDLIDEIIGINHKAMINSVMFSSEIYTSFLRVTEGKRLDIIESVLNLKQFQKWAESTKKLKKPIEEEYQHVKERIGKIDYGITTIEENISEYKSNARIALEELKEKKASLEEEKSSIEKELETYKDIDVDKVIEHIEEYEKVKSHNKEVQTRIDSKVEEKNKLDEELSLKSAEYNTISEKIREIERIDFEEELDKIKKSEKDANVKERIESIQKQKENIQSVLNQIRDLDKEIESLEEKANSTNDEICYACGQHLDKEAIDKIKEDLKTKRVDNEGKKEELKKEKVRIEEKNKNIDQTIEELNEGLSNVTSTYTEEDLNDFKANLSNLRVKEAELNGNLISLNDKSNSLSDQLKEIKKELLEDMKPSKYSKDFIENISKEIDEKKAKLLEIDSEVNKVNEKAKNTYDKTYVEKLNKKISTLNKTKKEEDKILKKKEEDITYYDYLLKIFSNKDYGIKKYVISKMIDLFNANINKYIPLFFDRQISVYFDKNLTESIKENDEEISFQSFSSGEKTLLDVAIAFSLYMLVKNFFSSDIRFLVFDEILDRNLDENGINAILNIIEEKAKTNSIMVISHRGEYKESFINKIKIYKEDGFSRLAYE